LAGHAGAARKKSDMLVLLDRDDGRYTAGDTVRGRVHIVLTQDVSVKGQPTTLIITNTSCALTSPHITHSGALCYETADSVSDAYGL